MKTFQRCAAIFVSLALLSSNNQAAYLKLHYSHELPQNYGSSMKIQFNGYLYLYSSSHFVRSTDGVNWEKIPPPAGYDSTEILLTHKNQLVGLFGIGAPFKGIVQYGLYSSSDGMSWNSIIDFPPRPQGGIWDPTNPPFYPSEIISDGTHIYLFETHGRIRRTTAAGNSPVFETIPSLPAMGALSMCIYKNQLHILILSYTYRLHDPTHRDLYRLTPQNNWEEVGSLPTVDNADDARRTEIYSFQNNLFAIDTDIRRTSGDSLPYAFVSEHGPLSTDHSFFEAFGSLFVFGSKQAVFKRDSTGNWSFFSPEHIRGFGPTLTVYAASYSGASHRRFAEVGNNVFFGTSDFWSMTRGVHEIKPAPQNAGAKLFSGAADTAVIGLSVNSNFSDSVTLTVQNQGTALPKRDVERIRLIKSAGGTSAAGAAAQVLAELQPDSQNPKLWATAAPVAVNDGDTLYVSVTLTPSAQQDATCLFTIPQDGLKFETNSAYQLPAPLTSNLFTIEQVAQAGEIPLKDGLVAYPQPGRDVVHFTFDLTSPADVTLKIFDRAGRLVSEVADPGKSAGRAVTDWDSSKIAPGVYYAVLKFTDSAGEKTLKKKVLIER